jgi:hypothetical protein
LNDRFVHSGERRSQRACGHERSGEANHGLSRYWTMPIDIERLERVLPRLKRRQAPTGLLRFGRIAVIAP